MCAPAKIQRMEDLVARASVFIGASRQIVWVSLLLPDTITKIMPVAEVIAPWRAGEPFVWAFEMSGKRTLVEGRVHRIEEGVLLAYEYGDPHSRDVLRRRNVHQVSIVLSDEGRGTRVSVTQDANVSRAAQLHAEGGWRLALNHLKGSLEGR
jgi:uncharacterized protein YndB with AHSA1/START domain